MAIAMKIASQISKSSWIRRMFEEGERLRQEFGSEKIYDFTLGNPDVEPPNPSIANCWNWRRTRCRECIAT